MGVAASLTPSRSNQGGEAIGSGGSGRLVTPIAAPITAADAGGGGEGVPASLTPPRGMKGVGDIGSGGFGLVFSSGEAPATTAEVGGGDGESAMAGISSSCHEPHGVGASKASSVPGLLSPAPLIGSQGPEAAIVAAAASDNGFWAASENIEDAFGPVGNNSVLNGVGPNVPVSSDAATAAAVAAAETGVVATTEAMPAPTMTSSPVIAAAGLEGAGATVTAHPATSNFSVSFPAFTPPLSSGREVA